MCEPVVDFGANLDHGNLLILGNGFDLNLGYPTSYKDFVNNTNAPDNGAFPFAKGKEIHSKLGKYIQNATLIKRWYDLENVLAEYGKREDPYELNVNVLGVNLNFGRLLSEAKKISKREKIIAADKEDYYKLIKSLTLYLKSIDLSHPIDDSVAARLLKALYSSLGGPPVIYSFNYTDLSVIGQSLGLDISPDSVNHVHGCLKNDDVILGVGDYADLRDEMDYMYKTFSKKYHSSQLFQALESCDTILIFGLALSQVDYPYFADFFKKLATGNVNRENKKLVRIFTYDDNSRGEILRNLRHMNKSMINLVNYCDFDIIRTKDNVDEQKVSVILEGVVNRWKLAL
jgi:hypothetical protein